MSTSADQTAIAIGHQVRRAREAAEISREHLARQVDTSLATITRLEREDHLPHVRTLARIAAVLDLSLDDLLAEGEDS